MSVEDLVCGAIIVGATTLILFLFYAPEKSKENNNETSLSQGSERVPTEKLVTKDSCKAKKIRLNKVLGIVNPGNWCYCIAVVQAISALEHVYKALISNKVLIELSPFFRELTRLVRVLSFESVSIRGDGSFPNAEYVYELMKCLDVETGNSFNHEQQDCNDFFAKVFAKWEDYMKKINSLSDACYFTAETSAIPNIGLEVSAKGKPKVTEHPFHFLMSGVKTCRHCHYSNLFTTYDAHGLTVCVSGTKEDFYDMIRKELNTETQSSLKCTRCHRESEKTMMKLLAAS